MTARYYGRLPKTEDPRDYRFTPPRAYTGAFVDLSAGFPQAPYDQGQLGSCVSNGTAGILDFARKKQGLTPEDCPARLFIYYVGRVITNQPINQDTGLQIRDGLTVVNKYGAPPETDWPYNIAEFAVQPPTGAYADAILDEAVAYGAVADGNIDATIASGYPVVIGFDVYESFESDAVAASGIMPVPKPGEQNVGGHCVVAVSTPIDGSKVGGIAGILYRKCRNSWGTSWGQAGYFYMPVSVMDSSEASDFWVLTKVSDPNVPTPTPTTTPTPTPTPVPSFPGALVAAVTAAAGDPKVARFLAERHLLTPDQAAAAHLAAILAQPRK